MTAFIIIGTAGRDKTKPMTLALWKWMLNDAYARVPKGSKVVSGGAAWADHIAVSLFLFDHAAELTLHLPAPFIGAGVDSYFLSDGYKSAGSAANHYHTLFGKVIMRETLAQIDRVICMDGCAYTEEPLSKGVGGMFARNAKVAATPNAHMLAYTFGEGNEPADGGTKNTWDKFQGPKTHISLPLLT